jgi:hypothetical protein
VQESNYIQDKADALDRITEHYRHPSLLLAF